MIRCVLWFCAAMVGGCDDYAAVNEADETIPFECADFNPCTDDFFGGEYGCLHEQLPTNTPCDSAGITGACANGVCIAQGQALCIDASTECVGDKPYVTNDLRGSCYEEWCNVDGPGRALRPKSAGSLCVSFINGETAGIGRCNPCGNCE